MITIRSLITLSVLSTLLLSNASVATEITIEILNINNEPAADLVTYILPLDNQELKLSKTVPLVVSQSKKKFIPYILVAEKDDNVTFINKDNITHHIYSASSENRFSFKIKSGAQKTIHHFSTLGKVLMGCNIHDWMSGYLLIVDTPLYSKTDFQGKSTINVPVPGRYKLIIWHPQLMEKNQQISHELLISKDKHFQVKLSQEMAAIPLQENPDQFDFDEEEDY